MYISNVDWHNLHTASYYRLSLSRLDTRATDDTKRDLAFIALQTANYENVEWLNNFVQKFWLIFEPVLSAYVIENIDTYLVDYLPGFLDSVRLTTFTLGSKPFRVESVKSFTDTEPDTVVSMCAWFFSVYLKGSNDE